MKIINNLKKILFLIFFVAICLISSLYIKNKDWLISIILLIIIPIICYIFFKKIYYSIILFLVNFKFGKIFLEANDSITFFLYRNKYIKIILISYVFFRIAYFIYTITNSYLTEEKKKLTIDKYQVLENSLKNVFENEKISNIFKYEFAILSYFFIFWKIDKNINNSKTYTYIKQSGSLTIYIALIGLAIIEIGVTHILLLRYFIFWVSIIFLYFNVYTFVFFIAHLKALYLRPIEIKENYLYLKNGLFANAIIYIPEIKEISLFENDIDYKSKDFFKFALIKKMENYNIKIILKKELKINLIYGLTRKTKEIYLFIDDRNEFYKDVREKLID